VTHQTLDGLFLKIAEQEKRIARWHRLASRITSTIYSKLLMKTLEFPVPRPALAPDHSNPVLLEPSRAERVFLLAEANEDHVVFTERAFAAARITDPLHVVPDGEAAMNYLRGTGEFNRLEHPLPDVVLLDGGLPGKSGFEVLKWLRAQPDLRALLVIVLTTSNRKADADRAFELGANYYLTRPTSFEALVRLARCLHEWLHCHHFQAPSVIPEQALPCAVAGAFRADAFRTPVPWAVGYTP
jgi:CheY-like chemotaxis protein